MLRHVLALFRSGLLLLAVSLVMTELPLLAVESSQRPNILLILSDDHAAHAIGCYGSKINRTPQIDRIANEGMRFDRCLCTNALCGPSRAVILTGKYSHLNGFRKNGDKFDGTQKTFPRLLQQAGYQTGLFGKWHLDSTPTGFDTHKILVGQGTYYQPTFIENGKRVAHAGYVTEIITDLTLDYLKKRDRNKPFLVMCQHKAPHRNWQPGPKQMGLYKEETIPEPGNLFDDYSGRGPEAREQKMSIARDLNDADLKKVPPKNLTPEQLAAWNDAYEAENDVLKRARFTQQGMIKWKYQRYIKDYLRCVAGIDASVGQLLDFLDKEGLAENTIVIYSSDQGFFLGDHGWYDKRFMYEESLRMPLLVRWPSRIKPGTINGDLVSNIDFAPTLVRAAGVSIPGEMQGASMLRLFTGELLRPWRPSHYYHYYEYPNEHNVPPHDGVRTTHHKLIHFYEADHWELFDLEKDPREMQSRYNDPAYAEIQKLLHTELQTLRKYYRVPGGDENPSK